MRRRLVIAVAALLIAGAGFSFLMPQKAESAVAIGGYDPVAYFSGQPTQGTRTYRHEWNGQTWLFASAENRNKFRANPESFAPQYNGFCAFAAANGKVAPANPEVFLVHDGKLYLNSKPETHSRWQQDLEANISAGQQQWERIRPN